MWLLNLKHLKGASVEDVIKYLLCIRILRLAMTIFWFSICPIENQIG